MERVLGGRYELHDVIGAGGAATVYRATDRQLQRDVAVKLLDDVAAQSADPGGRQRFLREARTGAAASHHNLVDTYDAGEDDGALFLVMELVRGVSLARLIADRCTLPVDEAVGIARQILAGLSALHATGSIHRDVKPANVLVDATGDVRLTDFGIAKRLDEIEGALTSHDTVIGTPTYLAPEQATGSGLSAATDVYAVGLVLYEMLTGKRALAPGHSMAALRAHTVLDPRTDRPDVPDHVAHAVMRATHIDPDRRFASAASMAEALTGGPSTVEEDAATRIMPVELAPTGRHEGPTRSTAPMAAATAAVLHRRHRRRAGLLATALAACVLLVGVVAVAGLADLGPPDSDPPPTEPIVPAVEPATQLDDTPATVPLATAAPPTVATEPAAPTPRADPAKRDTPDNQNGNGKAKGRNGADR